MRKTHTSIEVQLHDAYTVLTNIRANPVLLEALAAYGYTQARLAEGDALREAALAHYHNKITAYGLLRTIKDSYASAAQQTKQRYKQHIKLAQVALDGNQGALQMLYVSGKQKTTVAGWLAQAQHFYRSALFDEALLQQLSKVNLTRTVLEEGARQVAVLADQRAAYRQQRGVAQHTTSQRNMALTALDLWMRDLKQIARIVLRTTPQLLEQIGVTIKS